MRLTSMDIHHKEFRHSIRGYSQDEVDKFLDEVADEVDRLRNEVIDLTERFDEASEKVKSYQEVERTLNNTLMQAQRSAEDIVEKARREAEDVLRDAEVKAKEIIHNALSAKQKNQAELMRIKEAEEDFRARFRGMLEQYIAELKEVQLPEDIRIMTAQAGDERVGDVAVTTGAVDRIAETPVMAPEPMPIAEEGLFDQEESEPPAHETFAAEQPASDPFELIRQPEPAPAAGDEPPASGFVSGLHLGETSDPDLGPEEPVFEPPREFDMPSFSSLGERDDDVDIEEID